MSRLIQYFSDVHVDVRPIPRFQAKADYLALVGDLGKPNHPNVNLFLKQVSQSFKKVFFVPGNHDYDCGPLYQPDKINKWSPYLTDTCQRYSNIYLLNKSLHNISDNTIIAGCTLWSSPLYRVMYNQPPYSSHVDEHDSHVAWLSEVINNHQNKKLIILTHYVPTFRLIDNRYKIYGEASTSWFATDLEHLIKPPVSAWLCGHTHSIMDCTINSVYCGVNAIGYKEEDKEIETKIISF